MEGPRQFCLSLLRRGVQLRADPYLDTDKAWWGPRQGQDGEGPGQQRGDAGPLGQIRVTRRE